MILGSTRNQTASRKLSGSLIGFRATHLTAFSLAYIQEAPDSFPKAVRHQTAFCRQTEILRLTRWLPLSWQLPGTG